MKEYTFTASDSDSETPSYIEHRFSTEEDSWFPIAEQFFMFLKGQGYVFGDDSVLGVMDQHGKFCDPSEQRYI